MIDIKYKKIYDEFIKKYEEIHVNPWHQITKSTLNLIYNNLINSMDVNDKYSFKYFMDYIIKRLSGIDDAHTTYQCGDLIPLSFKIIENDIIVDYPKELKGYSLISINDINVERIIEELENVITYGTDGKRKMSIETSLFNRIKMFGLPSFRNSNKLIYKLEDINGNIVNKIITKEEKYDNPFDFEKYIYEKNAKYRIIDNCLVYNHSSIQIKYKKTIEESIKMLEKENLDCIDTIIIDLRGNTGGYSKLNTPLIDFLKKQNDKKLICLTDYRVFSGGRFALKNLIDLGAITIGEGIGTPINSYGNSIYYTIDNNNFTISSCYHNLQSHIQANTKEEFDELISGELLKPVIFNPNIEISENKKDYLNGIDTVLNYAIEYSKSQRLKK